MAAPSVFQILKSNAVLWFGPVGDAFPDETTVHAGELWGGNWLRLGATKEPLTCLYEDERADVNIEESLSPVHRFKTSEALTFETVLAEIDLDYIALATEGGVAKTAAGAAQKAFDSLTVGNASDLSDYAFGFEGIHLNSAGVALPMRVFMYRGNAKLGGELSFSKREDDYTGVPLVIEALSDSVVLGRLFKIENITGPTT